MGNNEVRQLLKNKYNQDVADITYRKFKAKLHLSKRDFLETLIDKITKNAVGIEIDFEKLEKEVRYHAGDKSLSRYLLDLSELKIRYLELSVRAFEAKNRLFKDEMDRLFKNRVLELEDKKIEISKRDIMNEIEVLAKQIDDNNV